MTDATFYKNKIQKNPFEIPLSNISWLHISCMVKDNKWYIYTRPRWYVLTLFAQKPDGYKVLTRILLQWLVNTAGKKLGRGIDPYSTFPDKTTKQYLHANEYDLSWNVYVTRKEFLIQHLNIKKYDISIDIYHITAIIYKP